MSQYKDAYYFPHDSNAQHDEKILQLRAKYTWAGYGIFWAIIERLRESKDYKFCLNAIPGLAISLSLAQAELEALLEDCCNVGLLTKNDGFFSSESLSRRMAKIDHTRERLREAGRRGGVSSSQAQAKLKPSLSNPQAVNQIKSNQIKSKEYIPTPLQNKQLKDEKTKYAEYVYMKPEQYGALVVGHGEKAAKRMIEMLDNYKGSKGKTYKDDYRAILSWVVDKFKEEISKAGEFKGGGVPVKGVAGPRGLPQSVKDILRQENARD